MPTTMRQDGVPESSGRGCCASAADSISTTSQWTVGGHCNGSHVEYSRSWIQRKPQANNNGVRTLPRREEAVVGWDTALERHSLPCSMRKESSSRQCDFACNKGSEARDDTTTLGDSSYQGKQSPYRGNYLSTGRETEVDKHDTHWRFLRPEEHGGGHCCRSRKPSPRWSRDGYQGLSSVCHTAIFMTFILLLHMTIVPGASFPFPPSGADAGDGGADGGGGAGKETKIDCHTYCERYLEQAEYTDGAGSRVEHCDALHRLLQCVRTMDVTAQDDNPLDPQHSQCLLHFGSFSVMTWVMKSLSDKCRGVPPPDDTKCNVSAACPLVVGKRRSLPAVCQTRHLQVCQVFGDRHLVRGNGEVLETCSMPGRWPLLHVRHVGVYASNTPHRLGGQLPRFDPDVTVATQLQSVEVHLVTVSGEVVVYQAKASQQFLEPTFRTPKTGFRTERLVLDPDDKKKLVTIWADGLSRLRTVEITLHWLCTVIVLRLLSNSLSISIAMPTEMDQDQTIMQPDVQLCRDGCMATAASGLLARYMWTGRRCRGRKKKLTEFFPDPLLKLNLTQSANAQHECLNILEELGTSTYLSACRWDVAMKSNWPVETRKEFTCSAEFAAYDQRCLSKLTKASGDPGCH